MEQLLRPFGNELTENASIVHAPAEITASVTGDEGGSGLFGFARNRTVHKFRSAANVASSNRRLLSQLSRSKAIR